MHNRARLLGNGCVWVPITKPLDAQPRELAQCCDQPREIIVAICRNTRVDDYSNEAQLTSDVVERLIIPEKTAGGRQCIDVIDI